MDRKLSSQRHTLVPLFLASFALALHVAAQEPQKEKPPPPDDVIRVFTDVVQTDVMVFNKQGRFVNGLKREDFALRVNGQLQPIEFFDQVSAGSASEEAKLSGRSASSTNSSTNSSRPASLDRGRPIFFYVDDFHLSAGDLILLRKALLKFIDDDLGQNDEAIITSASGQIGFLQQLTDNNAVLRAAIMRIKTQSPSFVSDGEQPPMNEHQALVIDRSPAAMGSGGDPLLEYFIQRTSADTGSPVPPIAAKGISSGPSPAELHVRARARAILEQAARFTENSLASFKSLVDSAGRLPGRKIVFFISDGFYTDRRNSTASQEIDQITRKASHSGTVIYSIDARGLTTGQPQPGEPVDVTEMTGIVEHEQRNELSESREGMTVLAVETGGRAIFDKNVLDEGIANAVRETSAYYLLGWRASHDMQIADKPPRVEVSLLARTDLSVRLGHGFSSGTSSASSRKPAASGESQKSSESKLRDALIAIYPSKDLPVALDLQYQRSDKGMMLTASTQIPIDSLLLTTQDEKEKAIADVAGFIYNDKGKVAQQFNRRMALTRATLNSMPDETFTFKYQAALTPGLYQVRVGIRDEQSGKTGTAHQWIEVPDLTSHKLALSSLIAGELVSGKENVPGRSALMILHANHRFRRDEVFRFLLDAYNASLGPTNSKPDLVVQAQILRDRQAVITTPFQEVPRSDTSSTERVSITADLPLTSLETGRYLLRITVIDRVAKTSASTEMHLEIE